MTDGCNPEHGRNRDAASSDNDDGDSVSLLCDLTSWRSSGGGVVVPEDMEVDDLHSQFGNEEQEKEAATEMNRLKPPESGIPSCADPTSHSAKVWQCVRLPNKVNVNKRNGKGETLLHKVCKRGDLAQVRALIQAGISINAEDNAGWTALHEASAAGGEAAVEELLKAGADVHARSFDGVTALHDAVYSGHCRVVKLLLQYGSRPSDRSGAGLSALDMAEEEEGIKELLSVPAASVPCEAPPCHRPPGDASSEAANVGSGDPGDGDRDVQPGRKESAANDRHSEALTVVLEEVRRKQTEISAWPLTGLEEAGRCHGALAQIQKVLIEALTKQKLEKDDLTQRCRRAPDGLRRHVLKSRLASLASRQRTVVELLQEQARLVDAYVAAKADLSTPRREARRRERIRRGRRRPVTQTSAVRSRPPKNAAGPPAPLPTGARPGNASSRVSFQMKGNNALIQTQDEDDRPQLSELVQSGVVPPGAALQLLLRGLQHLAHVQRDGSIKDGKGKTHRAPERWLESILGNNIPVSSTYAWDKVTFANKPLSHHLLRAEGDQEVDVQPEELTTEAASLRRLMRIKTIHLVDDEELLPNAVMERHWEKLLETDCSGCEDWSADVL
ncbi:uncharacterized protein [Cebidichthys violaceus]|uniref:uncharacterized protein isoform X2 n=1 Tax=Cebidichthys violaceus TaxID=271503 RepID=UPI0035CC99B8